MKFDQKVSFYRKVLGFMIAISSSITNVNTLAIDSVDIEQNTVHQLEEECKRLQQEDNYQAIMYNNIHKQIVSYQENLKRLSKTQKKQPKGQNLRSQIQNCKIKLKDVEDTRISLKKKLAEADKAVADKAAADKAAAAADKAAKAQVQQQIVGIVTTKPNLANVIADVLIMPISSRDINMLQAQQEVIRETSVLVIQNPEKYAVEIAKVVVKELKNDKSNLKEVFKEVTKVANDDTIVMSKTKQGQSLLFIANLAQVAPDKEKETMRHLLDQGTRSISIAPTIHDAVTVNINNHLSAGSIMVVSAGEAGNPIVIKTGLWVASTFGSSNQGIYKGDHSYKGRVAGCTIGGDLYIGENSLVGIAYSRMNSDFKFKGSNTGDKLLAESSIISLYGQQQFSNGLILQEIFSVSNSKINKKDLRPVGPNRYKTAEGKYASKAYGFEGNVGYQFSVMDGINLMPNIGIMYNTYKDNNYTETGTGVNNMYVAGKFGHLTTGIAGIKLTAPKRLSNDTQIVPGLHAYVKNSFSNKKPKVKARFIWADNYFENTTSSSTTKVSYAVGTSLFTSHKNIELLATYQYNLQSKYTSHQGSIKFKILF